MSDHVHSFEYYFKRNAFLSGADRLLRPFIQSTRQINTDNVQRIIDGLRLQLLARGFKPVEELLNKYESRIISAGKIPTFEVMLLRTRIAYKRGYYRRSYNLALHLITELEAFRTNEEKRAELERSILLPRVHIIAGKAIYRAMDHSLARIHFCLAYHLLTAKNLIVPPHGKHAYLIGRVYTLLARSYLDYTRTKENINRMLLEAKNIYKVYFGDILTKDRKLAKHTHLYLTEITELEALLIIDRLPTGDWLSDTIKILDSGIQIIDETFGNNRPHRRRAHLFRVKGEAHLKAAIEYRKKANGQFTDKVVRHLLDALKEYKKELDQRRSVFATEDHPTISRAYDYLVKVYLLMAEAVQKRGQQSYYAKYLHLAEANIKKGTLSNTPTKETIAKDQGINSHHTAAFRSLPDSADHHCISRLQQFKLAGKQLHLSCLRYRSCSAAERKDRFAEVLFAYQDCRKYQTKCLEYLYWDESRETVFERFILMQELALSACQAEFERHENLGNKVELNITFEQMLQINVQGKRNEDWRPHHATYPTKPKQLQLNGLRTKMAMIQAFNLDFFFLREAVISLKPTPIDYPGYEDSVREILAGNVERIRANRARVAEQQRLGNEHENYEIRANRIFREFNAEDPAGLLCYFVGSQHIYLLALFEGDKDTDTPSIRKAIRITSPGAPFAGIANIRRHAIRLNKTIRFLHKMARNAQGMTERKDKLDLSIAPTSFEQRLIAENEFCYYPDAGIMQSEYEINLSVTDISRASTADRINSQWLKDAYALYKLLLVPANIPPHTRRLYLTFNKNWLQETPFNLLPIEDPAQIFSREPPHFYRDLNYFGTTWQHAVAPCLADLWRLRTYHRDGEGRIRKDHGPALEEKDLAVLYGVRGIDTKPSPNVDYSSLSAIGAMHFQDIWDRIFKGRTGLPISKFIFAPPLRAASTRKKGDKQKILCQGQLALILYFICHIEYERTDKLDRKKIELSREGQASNKGYGYYRSSFDIYHEEIAENDYRNNWLVFINGCGAAQGAARAGYVPFSIMAAFLDGGSRAVIGTQFISYATPARHYARRFLSFWVGHVKGEGLPLGEALLETNRLLLDNPDKNYAKFANPIHWGSYLLLGDTTIEFEQLLNFLMKKRP